MKIEKLGFPTIVKATATECLDAVFKVKLAKELFEKFKKEDGIDWLVDWIGPDPDKEEIMDDLNWQHFGDKTHEWTDIPIDELMRMFESEYQTSYQQFKYWVESNFFDDIADSGKVVIRLFK